MQDANDNNDPKKSWLAQHGEAPLPEGFGEADYYVNENGLITFTSNYHLKRGYCCGSGCRHCPFDYESVPEPKRSRLIENRNNTKADFSE
jgi:hypothetical protein